MLPLIWEVLPGSHPSRSTRVLLPVFTGPVAMRSPPTEMVPPEPVTLEPEAKVAEESTEIVPPLRFSVPCMSSDVQAISTAPPGGTSSEEPGGTTHWAATGVQRVSASAAPASQRSG